LQSKNMLLRLDAFFEHYELFIVDNCKYGSNLDLQPDLQ